MGADTTIEWADHTFNPWIGCTAVSPACDNCYAEALATARLGVAWGPHAERRRTADSTWRQPLAWNRKAQREGRRYRVFCASLADVFDNAVPADWRADLFRLIEHTPHLDWLLLTKRPQNARRMIIAARRASLRAEVDERFVVWPWPNVWLGTTVENRTEMLRRAPALRAVPAVRHFWSAEPLLGDLGNIPADLMPSWIIAGGESGPKARPSHPEWFRSLRDQCADAGVPFFFKQWGEWREFDHGSRDEEIEADSETADAIFASAIRPGFVTRDGQFIAHHEDLPDETPCRLMERVGKKAAGATLDGREWREVLE